MSIHSRLYAVNIIKKSMLSAMLLFSCAAYLNAADAAGTARAEIIAPLVVSSMQNINFGMIMQNTTAETVAVIISDSGGVSGAAVHLGSHHKGIFTIQGQPYACVTFSVSDASLSGPGGYMSMSGSTYDKSSSPALDADGRLSVGFGASLFVGAGQEVGLYTGSYTITVNFI